ncbi:MAG: NUDIX hydrolase, partial [Dehalococcoidia bacterium]
MTTTTMCGVHKLVADAAVFADGKVLLVKYTDINKYDHQRGWFLPDDLMNNLEHPERAAKRILKEQVGLSLSEINLSHIESFKGNDGTWHLTFHYRVDLDETPDLAPSSDVAKAEWFSLDNLPDQSDVAHHGWAL